MDLKDRLYTSTEVAEILGVSLRSVYRYLEEDKIQADIKTATGRHRFSRKNILDFLYPEEEHINSSNNLQEHKVAASVKQNNFQKQNSTIDSQIQSPVSTDNSNVVKTPETKTETEEVDWLAKFRAAAERHRSQASTSTQVQEAPAVVSAPVIAPEPEIEPQTEVSPYDIKPEALSSLTNGMETTPDKPVRETSRKKIHYYTSSVGGLKELAQYINRSANKSGVSYAFTMNAGLSLHKLIKPFSILHIYVKEGDLEFFEKALELTASDETTAQLAIYLDRGTVLSNRRDLHGLSVVSDSQLRKDLIDSGEGDLASELDDVLNI